MKTKLFLIALLFFTAKISHAQTGFPFADEIRAFKTADSLHFPKPGSNLFIGSSSIRLWGDLEQRFEGKKVLKRGVGGSTLHDWVSYYLNYILFPYQPDRIFIYAGENDIAAGRTGQQVYEDFVTLYNLIQQKLPGSKTYWLSIKQSPSRTEHYNEVKIANSLVDEFINHHSGVKYIDVNTVLYKKDTSEPDSSLFKRDYLHLNSQGYDRWQKAIKKYVQ
ncbi:GDSL-type esterase/lipase family protein [Mucilaginibacter sp. RS28]|uniref:GDSL-type esterase/lipase family protein n=1 Tax=Mucilaginibacter straminoryzae TaxID=2932774 RepID=A0A9X1X1I5_9SPHI|nr:GDSL-type esterase/lipase family protein [Mucilaginibacter straminoryzae]MCJ8209472.1 GDSL-type esterase/lipase family protein [Mucilaginibacter straminoryzae]